MLIPLQVENSSKKRKVRLRLASDHTRNPLPNAVSESGELPDAVSECGELPDAVSKAEELPHAPPTDFNLDPSTSSFLTFPVPEDSIPHGSTPGFPVDHFKLQSLDDEMAEDALEQRPTSAVGSLDEFDDTPEEFSRPPLAIGGMSEVACGKQPAYPPHTHLARHGYRQPSVIPESEEDDPMDDHQGSHPPLQQPPQQPYQLQLQYQP